MKSQTLSHKPLTAGRTKIFLHIQSSRNPLFVKATQIWSVDRKHISKLSEIDERVNCMMVYLVIPTNLKFCCHKRVTIEMGVVVEELLTLRTSWKHL